MPKFLVVASDGLYVETWEVERLKKKFEAAE